jgi:hypothetical protein
MRIIEKPLNEIKEEAMVLQIFYMLFQIAD